MSFQRKVTYTVVSLASGLLGGALADAVFSRFWRAISGDAGEVPEPAALERSIRDVLVAGALHGAVFGLIKAALERISAKSYLRLTGQKPER